MNSGRFLRLIFLGATAAIWPLAGRAAPPPTIAEDPIQLPKAELTLFGQIDEALITAVTANAETVFVEFTGHWILPKSLAVYAARENSISVSRGQGMSDSAWAAFVQRFTDVKGKTVAIFISNRGNSYAIRGGVPLLELPDNEFQIVLPGQKFNYPKGSQF